MELVVFDLDGTLLNRESVISDYTSETLKLLTERNIAYTVATGRTLHGARAILEGHCFQLPQAYKNGVMIWHPKTKQFSRGATLTPDELDNVVRACITQGVTPFVFALDENNESIVSHPPLQTDIERELIRSIGVLEPVKVRALDELFAGATITHVNSIGDGEAIKAVLHSVNDEPHLVAYSGVALEGQQWRWLDVHHSDASKGGWGSGTSVEINIPSAKTGAALMFEEMAAAAEDHSLREQWMTATERTQALLDAAGWASLSRSC